MQITKHLNLEICIDLDLINRAKIQFVRRFLPLVSKAYLEPLDLFFIDQAVIRFFITIRHLLSFNMQNAELFQVKLNYQ